MQGKTINGYTLQRPLGTGGMAEVWLAENAIGKKAAVKLLLPRFCGDEGIVARFHNEAKVMVQLDHPNIRQVYDYGNLEGRPVIVMEYLEGDDLKAMMKQGRRFNNEELVKWWNQIADALNYTHQQGIVHRDIKPSNIFLDRKGNIKLLDFGIAKIKESISMTQTGAMMGTLMYMSPEQVEDSKHIGPESDVYSLAVSFVHLLTGKAPYDSTTSSDYAIRKGIVELPLDLSALPEAWRNFLAPYLAKKPEDRPELRPFELVEDEEVPQAPDEDEGTVVAGTQPEPEEPARAHPTTKQPVTEEDEGTFVAGTEPKETPTPSDGTKKSKTGLWIGIGAAVVAVVLAVLLLTPKNNAGLASTYGSANGHDYVDLGLPSGTLWATCNIGASKPEDYGNYYAWGETQPQASNAYDWSSYKYANGTSWDDPKFTKYCDASDYGNNGFTDDLTELLSGDDPAAANWGGGWRTPTKAQWDELLSNTTHQWTTQNGVSGRLFTSKNNGQTLFLPAAGGRWGSELHYAGSDGGYWSRSLYTVSPNNAWTLYFYSDNCDVNFDDRSSGFAVRPVRQK